MVGLFGGVAVGRGGVPAGIGLGFISAIMAGTIGGSFGGIGLGFIVSFTAGGGATGAATTISAPHIRQNGVPGGILLSQLGHRPESSVAVWFIISRIQQARHYNKVGTQHHNFLSPLNPKGHNPCGYGLSDKAIF